VRRMGGPSGGAHARAWGSADFP